ncbi:MAG: hypothetical protein OCD76_11590 [Reichenbachiella sp.]
MNKINNKSIRLVEFDTSSDWSIHLPTNNWLLIILSQSSNKTYFNEIIKKSIDRNVGYICSIGEQQQLIHEMADEEISFRHADIEPNHLPKHMIPTTGHEDLDEGVWFGIFSAFNEDCDLNDVVIINATNEKMNKQGIVDLLTKFQSGYIPTND